MQTHPAPTVAVSRRTARITVQLAFAFCFMTRTTAHAQFAGGDGSAETPYLVATAEHLDTVRGHLGAHFIQTADIDLGVAPWNEGAGWMPIGSSTAGQQFSGIFDGGGHAIRGLTINRPGVTYQGLFGYLDGATVRDLRLDSVDLLGGNYSGALAGYAHASGIQRVEAFGAVAGGNFTGGLIGYHSTGWLSIASFSGSVQGGNYTGGLIGQARGAAHLHLAQSRGQVAGGDYAGGLVGFLGDSSGSTIQVTDSFSRSAVTGSRYVGGLIGGTQTVRVERCFSDGAVSGTGINLGGLIGATWLGASLRDAFWDIGSSGQTTSASGTGLSSAAMRQRSTYGAWNFNTVWRMEEGVDLPRFQELRVYRDPQPGTLDELDGEGTLESPYLVRDAADLNAMRLDLAAHYRLANDIDLASTVAWDGGRGWLPVGSSAVGQRFTGSLDGAGHSIRNLSINRMFTNHLGLFGYLQNATVRRLRLEDADIRGDYYTGILAGIVSSITLESVHASGVVRGASTTGGLIGNFYGGTGRDLSFTGRVEGTGSSTGGLLGNMASGSRIHQAGSRGSVTGVDQVGGLVGAFGSGSASGSDFMVDVYSQAAVNGRNSVGGLIGTMTYSRVDRGYSAGAVSGSGNWIGGFVGGVGTSANVHESYWDRDASGQSESVRGIGRSTAEMGIQASYPGWNFESLWMLDTASGYPAFQDLSRFSPPLPVALAELAGEGTAEDPYLITTPDELNAMRQDVAAHYRLAADLDLAATVVWNGGRGWEPVGPTGWGMGFTGQFNGGGHVIRNLTISRPANSHQGLFGFVNGGTLTHLRLENVRILGGSQTGALAGAVQSSSGISHVHAEGSVSGSGSTGGLIGSITSSHLIDASFAGTVRGQARTGGLLGETGILVRIAFVRSQGHVEGTTQTGGLIGEHRGSDTRYADLYDAYSSAEVVGTTPVGGLIGHAAISRTDRAYSEGAVTGSGANVGGFLGSDGGSTAFRNTYWDREASGREASAGEAVGVSSAEMRRQSTFAHFNFRSIWWMEEGHTPPRLREVPMQAGPEPRTLDDLAGSGLAGDPYLITDVSDLHAVRLNSSAYYQLANDIDLAETAFWNLGAGWAPLFGNLQNSFTGVFDGNGHTLRNLAIHRPGETLVGLFSYVSGTIRDLRLENIRVQGGGTTSGLVASLRSGGSIQRVHVTGEVRGGHTTGGLAASILQAGVTSSSFSGRVRGGDSTGGLIGSVNISSTVSRSSSHGRVRGLLYTGGLVGDFSVSDRSPEILDSYSFAEVSGADHVGGFVGRMGNSHLYRSYSIGAVTGDTENVGGLIGSRSGTTTVSRSRWDTETSGIEESAGGVGYDTADMWLPATYPDWDFVAVWEIEAGVNYPQIRGNPPVLRLDPAQRDHRNGASSGHAFEVRGNAAWTAVADEPWITLSGDDSGFGDGVVLYDLAANPDPQPREGTITVTSGTVTAQLRVRQQPLLRVWPVVVEHCAPATSGHLLHIEGNAAWTAATAADWILLDGAGEGADDGQVLYHLEENTSFSPRSGAIVISGGGLERTVAVHQVAALPAMRVEDSAGRHVPPQGASGETLAVTANHPWSAASEVDWIVLTSGASGTGDGVVGYDVAATAQHAPRLGHVTVTDGQNTFRHRVLQDAAGGVVIRLASDPPSGGWLSGGGTYPPGHPVEVRARDSTAYLFERWTEDGVTISTDPVLLFNAGTDRDLTAVYRIRTYAVDYQAGTGGQIAGASHQVVDHGAASAAVSAVADAGAVFHRWSDGRTDATRTDTDIQAGVDVTAIFRSTGGADLDWYAARGIAPAGGESWADVDARPVPAKGTTLREENLADTDPDDPADRFEILAIEPGPPATVRFAGSSSARAYTLQATAGPAAGMWSDVPGQGPRTGTDGADAMSDDGGETARFYRIKVELP